MMVSTPLVMTHGPVADPAAREVKETALFGSVAAWEVGGLRCGKGR
jgi:hypothetical protein